MCGLGKIILRRAQFADSLDILSWRNDANSRIMFRNSEAVGETQHNDWMRRILYDENIFLFIGELNGRKIGVCRFDLAANGDRAEVSINLNPLSRGLGLGERLLDRCITEFRNTTRCRIIAEIKDCNNASIRIFEKCGFKRVNQFGNWYRYELPITKSLFSEDK